MLILSLHLCLPIACMPGNSKVKDLEESLREQLDRTQQLEDRVELCRQQMGEMAGDLRADMSETREDLDEQMTEKMLRVDQLEVSV